MRVLLHAPRNSRLSSTISTVFINKSPIFNAPPPPTCNCNHAGYSPQQQPQIHSFPLHRPLTTGSLLSTHPLKHHPFIKNTESNTPRRRNPTSRPSQESALGTNQVVPGTSLHASSHPNSDSFRPMTVFLIHIHHIHLSKPHTIIYNIQPHTTTSTLSTPLLPYYTYLHKQWRISIHIPIPIPPTAAHARNQSPLRCIEAG